MTVQEKAEKLLQGKRLTNVNELINFLSHFPYDTPVDIYVDYWMDFTNGLGLRKAEYMTEETSNRITFEA